VIERESDDNEEGESGSDNAPEVPVAKSVDDKVIFCAFLFGGCGV
jgi:hypothetical protein